MSPSHQGDHPEVNLIGTRQRLPLPSPWPSALRLITPPVVRCDIFPSGRNGSKCRYLVPFFLLRPIVQEPSLSRFHTGRSCLLGSLAGTRTIQYSPMRSAHSRLADALSALIGTTSWSLIVRCNELHVMLGILFQGGWHDEGYSIGRGGAGNFAMCQRECDCAVPAPCWRQRRKVARCCIRRTDRHNVCHAGWPIFRCRHQKDLKHRQLRLNAGVL